MPDFEGGAKTGRKIQFQVFKWLLIAIIGGTGYICTSSAAEFWVNTIGFGLILLAAAVAKYADADA